MRTTDKYILFWTGILSNWAQTPYDFGGEHYCCSEQQYMRYKAMHFGDLDTAEKIMASTSPKRIKQLGRMVRNYDDTEWSKVRVGYMKQCLRAKFRGNAEARKFLLKQPEHHIFAEASPFDTIWGIGYAEDGREAQDSSTWRGQNLLGYTLTEVYNELKQETKIQSLFDE